MFLTKEINCLSNLYKNVFLKTIICNNLPKVVTSCVMRCGFASAPSAPAAPSLPMGAQPIGKRRFRLPVEQDVEKIVNYCCGANYHKEGEDIKLKADEEYPDWIWSLRLNYPPPIHELDPKTHEYWERLAIVGQQREWRSRRLARRSFKIVSQRLINIEEMRYRRRFRALASKHFDAGYDVVEHTEREDFWNLELKDRFREPDEKEIFYPGIDSIEMPYQVKTSRIKFKHTKRCGHFGW